MAGCGEISGVMEPPDAAGCGAVINSVQDGWHLLKMRDANKASPQKMSLLQTMVSA